MTHGGHPPPSSQTPTPRRFLLSKRGAPSSASASASASSSQHQLQPQHAQQQEQEATAGPRQFQVPPLAGSGSQRFHSTPRFAPPSSSSPSSANTPPGPRSTTHAPAGLGLTSLGFAFSGTQRRQRNDPIRDDGPEEEEEAGGSSPLRKARDAPSVAVTVARRDSIEGDSTCDYTSGEDRAEEEEGGGEEEEEEEGERVTSDVDADSEGPTPKRRRFEVSSEDGDEEEEQEEEEQGQGQEQDQEDGDGDEDDMSVTMSVEEQLASDDKEDELSEALPESHLAQRSEDGTHQKQQPTFQPAPRFKVSEAETTARAEGLPEAFSPQRRGTRYVPGGLAAGLQSWLAEVREWGDDVDGGWAVHTNMNMNMNMNTNTSANTNTNTAVRVAVDEVRDGRRMYLVQGRRVTTGPRDGVSMRLILAGEGKLTGLARRASVRVGSVLVISQPTWEVTLENQGRWTVACDWVVLGKDTGLLT
ncbi:hypothetical protein SODALDRAFT_114473 [Sodiomyces alkalinus F11]|uniref:Uncharacterized protein n=1 Tax=Sodiomyces alkalinus (strain CBS 110278 / VKM F-3762 / F11) TaxID=1314773 RepID=A0A3N2Q371_SODAK|nr:hypothetical protein SODALDRAFT_114473 [Sodiomyces alkalinus F11]ROT41214.1 hypothetical protein SODALDRAFT_114473 [Sodiomyces alkalinus F11]